MNTTPQLRPMSLGDMLDAAFRLYREHFVTFVGMVALVQVPMAIVRFILEFVIARNAMIDVLRFSSQPPVFRPGQNPFATLPVNSFLTFYGIIICVAIFQGLIVQTLITGALANVISRSYLGKPISILIAYSFGLRRYISLILSALIILLIGAGVVLVFAGCLFAMLVVIGLALRGSNAAVTGPLLGMLALIGFIVLFLLATMFFFIRFILATQVIVLEGQGPIAGLGRSWQLVGSSFWRVLGVFISVLVLFLLISFIPSLLMTFGLDLISNNSMDDVLRNRALGSFAAQIGLIVGLPLLFSIYTLLYYDLRVRKEGYDIEVMAQQTVAT
jgi:hypothetical protein